MRAGTWEDRYKLIEVAKGRPSSTNNDVELIAIALERLTNGTYKSYVHAARELAQHVCTYAKGQWTYAKDFKYPELLEPHIKRLQRSIGEAYKDAYGQSLRDSRK